MPATQADRTPNDDRSHYLVLCRMDGEDYFPERDASDCTEQETVFDIASGQLTGVQAVFCFNPIEGWSRNVTEDIARQVLAEHLDAYGSVEEWALGFLEHALGCQAVVVAQRELVA